MSLLWRNNERRVPNGCDESSAIGFASQKSGCLSAPWAVHSLWTGATTVGRLVWTAHFHRVFTEFRGKGRNPCEASDRVDQRSDYWGRSRPCRWDGFLCQRAAVLASYCQHSRPDLLPLVFYKLYSHFLGPPIHPLDQRNKHRKSQAFLLFRQEITITIGKLWPSIT